MISRCVTQIRTFCSVAKPTGIMKYLCVAEKNDAAKTISGFLSRGGSNRREGLSQYNKIYEFDMNLGGNNTRLVFTSVSGHLLQHEFTAAFRNWHSCNPEQLFEAPVIKFCPENYQKIQKTLEREIRTCNGLIIWTDCDREGENIGYEIIDVCRSIKPNITVKRAKFSDMTSASLHRAMNNLIQPDKRISDAVDIRSELDLRLGAAFTRFQTLRLQNAFPQNVDSIVSYGSCQIPTLGFVAKRYKEIENFISKPFWKVKMTHTIKDLTVEFNWARNRLFDKPCCEAFLMLCQSDGEALITNVLQKPKNKWRPQPMDTVELEKTGSRKLKLSAKVIMTIAEKLYTQGFMSYPRTETNQFSKDFNLLPLVEMQVRHRDWGEFATRVLEWGPSPRNGNKSDQAHPPIHPTKYTDTLQGNEKRVYDLIVRHFLACISRDAVGSETVVSATIGKEEFTATGLIILERNYLDVYIYDRWSGKEIHDYATGQTFTPTELSLHEGATNPPGMLTEADLIALMEKHGIGTDATHAEHINTIKERGYIGELDQGHLVPGTLGMGLVEGYELMNLEFAEPRLRAGLEKDLKDICLGLKNPQAVLAEQIRKYKECYQIIAREVQSLDQAIGQRFRQAPQAAANVAQMDMTPMRELFKCPKCKTSAMIIRQKKDNSGFYISCQAFPDCRNVAWLPSDVKTIDGLDEVCGACGGQNKKVKIKFSNIATLAMVNENPAFSRIDGAHFITCLVCDESLRRFLQIRPDVVKVLGNIVGATTRPVQQNQPNNQRPIVRDPPARGFGTNSAPDIPRNQNRRGFGDDDDDRPSGGGAATVGNASDSNQNRGWNSNTSSGNNSYNGNASTSSSNNQSRGWNSGASGSGNNSYNGNASVNNQNRGWNNDRPAGNNNQSRGWDNGTSSTTFDSSRRPAVNLKSLPNLNCDCNKQASKLTVGKQNENHGRPFYSCADRKCKFFQWADEQAPANNRPGPSNAQAPGNNRQGQGTRAGGGPVAKRKCGICKQEGHTRRNCPNAN